MVSEPRAVVPATPVSVTIAAPVAVSEPTEPVQYTPVSVTLASQLTDSEPKAEVPARPVNATDTLATTGASAGGATALAQAALASKKGVSASIEQQEVANEKLRAQGQQKMEMLQMSEAQRIQGIQISEGQRMQTQMAAGEQFVMQTEEN